MDEEINQVVVHMNNGILCGYIKEKSYKFLIMHMELVGIVLSEFSEKERDTE